MSCNGGQLGKMMALREKLIASRMKRCVLSQQGIVGARGCELKEQVARAHHLVWLACERRPWQ